METATTIFLVGKMYERIAYPHAADTRLVKEPNWKTSPSRAVVGYIKVGTPFILLQIETNNSKTMYPEIAWYKVLTSEGIMGWVTLSDRCWKEVTSSSCLSP